MNPFKQAVIDFITAQTEQAPEEVAALLEVPKEAKFGDFAFPCFTLAKQKRMAPPKIAAEMAETFEPNDLLESVNPVGPYLNFFARTERLVEHVLTEVRESGRRYGSASPRDETVVIDFGSPNIAKPQGVHHILSTVIGNSIANIEEHLGYHVVRLNYLGDWGTNHGKLIAAYRRWGSEEELAKDAVQHMLDIYVKFTKEAEEHPELEDEAREWFRKLEQGDPEALRIWEAYREGTRIAFERAYDRLGVRYDSYKGEASYQFVMQETMQRVEKSGVATVSQGALIVDLESQGIPVFMIRKSDGTSTYGTRDIAAAIDRHEMYGFAKNIYVTQMGQWHSHFQGLFKTLEMMGFDWADRCQFVGFGNMHFGEGMMSTRHGRIILLEDLLDMAEAKVREIIAELNPELANKEEVARQVGVGAVIFATLLNDRTRDVLFELETAVKLDGDTSAYIQYNHARIASILRKSGLNVADLTADPAHLTEPEARELALLLLRFPEVIRQAEELYKPSVLARYLLDLTKSFVTFYHKHHVLTAEPAVRDARLALLESVRTVMATGLGLLGIEAPEEM